MATEILEEKVDELSLVGIISNFTEDKKWRNVMDEMKAYNRATYVIMYIARDWPLLIKRNDGIYGWLGDEKVYPEVEYNTRSNEILTTSFDESRSKKIGVNKQYLREEGCFKHNVAFY